MRILRYTEKGFATALSQLCRRAGPAAEVAATVSGIVAAIRARGDTALADYTARFGGPTLRPAQMRVSAAELAAARKRVDTAARLAIGTAYRNVRAFAQRSLRKDWTMRNAQGVEVGERFQPFERVGIYVPGGTAPLVSTAIMTCALAEAAGVPGIVVTTPAGKSGALDDALLCALETAGATEIYKVGGAQAIAALACGTKTIKPVAKIFGPGNAYVVEAKRQVFGLVAVDLLPGPSEILVIADKTANPAWVAADMLAQAEHGAGSIVGLVTDSSALLQSVHKQLHTQAAMLTRHEHLMPVLKEGTFLVLVKNMDAAVQLANDFAPEHLSIVAKNDEALARKVRTSGAIFLGPWSPVAGGDFVAGPSHELPTGGAGKSFAGLTVDQFQRRTSLLRFSEEALAASLPAIERFSAMEHLDAHGHSASIRLARRVGKGPPRNRALRP